MRFRRTPEPLERGPVPAGMAPASDADQATLLVLIYLAFTEQSRVYAELLGRHEGGADAAELREQALAATRHLALVQRTVLRGGSRGSDNLLAGIPNELSPWPVLAALERLTYACGALADDDHIPGMLLSRAELDGLAAQYELGPWLAAMGDRIPTDTEPGE